MKKDLTGQRFGRLVAFEPTDKRSSGSVVWRCRCDCGNVVEVPVKRLTRGTTRSCGCLAGAARSTDLTGQRYGKLVVLRRAGTRRGHALWECACDCGNTTEVAADVLTSGRTKSCGCLRGGDKAAGYAADLTGQRFGRLVATRRVGSRGSYALWECRCDCGNTCEVTSRDLKHGGTRSCGCLRREVRGASIAGQRFGCLYAVNPTDKRDSGSVVWRCLCDCDRVVEATARQLTRGTVTSCGHCDEGA